MQFSGYAVFNSRKLAWSSAHGPVAGKGTAYWPGKQSEKICGES